MDSLNRKQLVYDVIKHSKLFCGDKDKLDLIAEDVLKKSSFIFEVARSDNEIYNYLASLTDASILRINENDVTKETGGFMRDYGDSLYSVDDPKTLSFDISDEGVYLKKLLIKLYELEKNYKDKSYAAIFYERYIQKLPSDVIAKMHNISENELNSRLLDIVKHINNKDAEKN